MVDPFSKACALAFAREDLVAVRELKNRFRLIPEESQEEAVREYEDFIELLQKLPEDGNLVKLEHDLAALAELSNSLSKTKVLFLAPEHTLLTSRDRETLEALEKTAKSVFNEKAAERQMEGMKANRYLRHLDQVRAFKSRFERIAENPR